MIDTVIFDYGNTLVTFKEDELVKTYTKNPDDAKILLNVFLAPEYWQKLDAGTLTHDEWLKAAKKRLPDHLYPIAVELSNTWYYRLPDIEGMAELVKSLKARGVKLYLLSNISKAFAEHISDFPLLSLFDGIVCSGVEQAAKPERKIYEILIERYHLATNSCVFIDDRQDNLDTAAEFGIRPYRFDGDAAKLSAYLNKILVK